MSDPTGSDLEVRARSDSAAEAETDEFLHALSRDVSPVERVAPVRIGVLRVFALWGALTAAALATKGLSATFASPAGWLSGFGAVLVGLSLVGVGGLVAALAAAIPGREPTARAGSALLAFGVLVAVGLGALLLRLDPAAAVPASLRSDATCLVFALGLALLPSFGALLYVVRAAPVRPVAALGGIGAGCVALGAFTAQLGCMDAAFRHLLVSHALAPAIGAALFLVPLWLGFRRLRPA